MALNWDNITISRRGLLAGALSLAITGVLTGCLQEQAPANSAASAVAPDAGSAPQNNPSSNKVLVVYFSHQGRTRGVAEEIAERTNADVFEIVPTTPYPEGMPGAASVAEGELDANVRPNIQGAVEDIAVYDTVFLGFPIWYGTAPMVVGTFLESHDLSGKQVQPFCTSSYNTIDEGSLAFIRELVPNAVVGEGCTANSTGELNAWFSELGY